MPAPISSVCLSTARRHWMISALAAPSLGLLGCSTAALTLQERASTLRHPWQMPGVHSFDMPATPLPGSSSTRQHRVMVYVPQGPAPQTGWPVIYVLDGNLMFAPLAQLIHNRGARGVETRGPSAIVVGLGHALPVDSVEVHDRAARTYDYTPPFDGVAPDSQGRAQGGADAFLDWMSGQLQPRLQAQLPINPQQRTLVGHSYGGLCTLHTLFTRPAMFQRYVAASPSLWWGNGMLLDEAVQFMRRHHASPLTHKVNVYVSQGSLEMGQPRGPQPRAAVQAEREASARKAQQRAQQHGLHSLAELSQALNSMDQLSSQHDVWPGANHGGTQMFACMQAARIGIFSEL